MISFIHLPEYLHLDVLSFLATFDQREVLRVNTEFLGLWRKVRTIKLTKPQFLTYSRSYQLELLSMIHNPYEQLDLELKTLDAFNDYRASRIAASENEDHKLYTELQLFDLVLNTWAFSSLHILQLELNKVISILENTCLKKVHTLDLYGTNEDSSELLEQVFELLAKKNNYEGMQLNSLVISFCVRRFITLPEVEVRCLPAIQNLQKLKFNQRIVFHDLKWLDDFKALKYVGFTSSDFRCDITCLNRFQCLELRSCTGFTDISSLNNNLRISIDECVGISAYSKCFQKSECSCLGITKNEKVISLSDYPIVKRVSLLGDGLVHFEIPKTHMNAQLRYLHLFEVRCDKVISFPPNNLQRLIIACSNSTLTNIEGIENIPDISLHYLDNLVSIGNVDVGNKAIKIRRCNKLNVTSCLRYCENISIEGLVKIDKPFDVPQLKRLTVINCADFIQMLFRGYCHSLQELQSLQFAGSRDEWRGIVFSKLQELEVNESLFWKIKDTPHFELHPLDPSQFPSLMKIAIAKQMNTSLGFTPMENFQKERRYEPSFTTTFLKQLTQPTGLSQACREELKRIRNELERTLHFVYNHEAVGKEYGFNEENIRAFENVLKVLKEKGPRQSVIENIKRFSSEPL